MTAFRMTTHADGSVSACEAEGDLIGWTDLGPNGWYASWRSRTGEQHVWADTPQAAAYALRTALAEEQS